MRKRFGLIATIAVAASLVGAAGATAATEVGSNCIANAAQPGGTVVPISYAPGQPLPIAAPSGGVVTKWKSQVIPGAALPQQLKVFRPAGAPNVFTAVGDSTFGTVNGGTTNAFDTQLSVQAGDRFGLHGPGPTSGGLYCNTGNAADVMGQFLGAVPFGTTQAFPEQAGAQPAVAVVIEPDADNDGFGDETQDKCPQSAALQTECPVITLTTTGFVGKGLAQILVSASSAATVSVSGTVNVPKKRKKGKGKAGKSALVRINGGTQGVTPGVIAKFTLILPQQVKAALQRLPRKRFLTLTATASATDVAGRPSSSTVKVKLRGTKPVPKGKGKG
jgi:hypothetical protein